MIYNTVTGNNTTPTISLVISLINGSGSMTSPGMNVTTQTSCTFYATGSAAANGQSDLTTKGERHLKTNSLLVVVN
mgnify:CR=1 FL=1